MEEFEPLALADWNLENFYEEARNASGDYYSWSACTMKTVRSGLDRYLSSSPYRKPFSIIRNRLFIKAQEVLDAHVWATSRNFNHFERVFVSAIRKPSFSDATSTASFFCNRRQKLVVRRCSAPNNPTEKWASCSEWIIWPEFSHGCDKFGSWFQNLPVSRLHVQLSFQLSKLNSGYDRFDDHLIQSNNTSGSKRS